MTLVKAWLAAVAVGIVGVVGWYVVRSAVTLLVVLEFFRRAGGGDVQVRDQRGDDRGGPGRADGSTGGGAEDGGPPAAQPPD